MNKDKYVLPDVSDTFTGRIRIQSIKQRKRETIKTIYGADNEPLTEIDVKKGR